MRLINFEFIIFFWCLFNKVGQVLFFRLKHMELFQGCQRIVEDWQKIIQVRTLVLTPQEDMYTWLKYASLCRKSGRLVRLMIYLFMI